MVQPLWKTDGGSSKTKTELPYDLGILLLGLYQKEMKTLGQEISVPPMLLAVSSTTAKM